MSVVLDTPAAGPATSEDCPPPPFEPYIAAATTMRELTVLPLVVGTVLGVIFGASSLYLVLKVGLTVKLTEVFTDTLIYLRHRTYANAVPAGRGTRP